MGNLNELHRVIVKSSRELNQNSNGKLNHSYYSVKYNYNSGKNLIELSSINSIEMDETGKKVVNVKQLTSENDQFDMTITQLLDTLLIDKLCISFDDDKYLCFLSEEEIFKKYIKINDIPSEGHCLLRYTFNNNYTVADRAMACSVLANRLIQKGCKSEATELMRQLKTYLNAISSLDTKEKKKLKRKRK